MKEKNALMQSAVRSTFAIAVVLSLPFGTFTALAAPLGSKHAALTVKGADDAESQAFLASLRARILNNWLLPDGINTVILEATVSQAGDVADVNTSKSSADALAVQAATEAFNKAQPLGHLPAKYKTDCKIILTFTTKVDPHGDSTSNLGSQIEPIVNSGGASGSASDQTGASGQPQSETAK